MKTFKLDNVEYPIELNYRLSLQELPKLGVRLNDIFADEDAASETMQNLLLDDEKTLLLAWHFIKDTASFGYDDFLDKMSPRKTDTFREVFWEEVANFSGALKENLLRDMWREFKKALKNPSLEQTST